MNDVLVLNASYEPLARVSWERAITLVIAKKAVIEEALEDRLIRSQHGDYLWPIVVRLLRYVKVPFSYGPQPFTKIGVLRRDNHKCAYCGKAADTIDHIKPQRDYPELARDWENTVSACFPCNNSKGARTPKEAHMTLLFKPSVPMQFTRLRKV